MPVRQYNKLTEVLRNLTIQIDTDFRITIEK